MLFLGTGTVYAADAIAKSTAIGAENAQNFAFADAGIDPAAAKIVRTEFGFEHGQFVYEVEFVADGTEYEYWIKSSDGTVVKKEIEIVTQDGAHKVATAEITADEAKEIALADAGLTVSDVAFTEEKLDLDDSTSVYELKFYTSEKKYEYEINASTGAVHDKSVEAFKGTVANPGNNVTNSNTGNYISVDKAKEIAVGKAGLSVSGVTFQKAKLDYDDGRAVYEIEFFSGGVEYECEVDASSGTILDYSSEREYH